MSSVRVSTLIALALLLSLSGGNSDSGRAHSQETFTVWVYLDPVAARSDLPPAVSAETRARRGILDNDRPVNPELVARIAATGARVHYVSRWLRAVNVDADRRTLARLRVLPEVIALRPALAGIALGGPGRVVTRQQQDSAFYGATYAALRELNIPVLHTPDLGLTGVGIRIAILDSGFSLLHESLFSRFVAQQRDFVNGDNNVDVEPGDPANNATRHGTLVWSLLGGYQPGKLVGGAYNASFYLAKVDEPDFDTRSDEARWVAAVEWADSFDVQLIHSSIGFRRNFLDRDSIPYGDLDGNKTATTLMADEAARRGILVVVAIGNSGPTTGTLWAPADADDIISVGAVDSLTQPLNPDRTRRIALPTFLSSRGPATDGRTKPELAARGSNLEAASHLEATSYERPLSGSSFAAPFISAGAALFMQAWPGLSNLSVRDALQLAGSNALAPDNATGHGVPDIAAAIMMPAGIVFPSNAVASVDTHGNLTTIAPTFSWAANVYDKMRPITYRLEIARDSFFTNMIYVDSVTEAFTHRLNAPLRPVTRAWWRVVATSPQGITRVSRNRTPITMPRWVTQLTLAEPQTQFIDDARPQLSWAPRSAPPPFGSFIFEVQVISNATGLVVQRVRDLSSTTVRIPEPLATNEAYRWRVIARTQTGVADTVETSAPFVVVSSEAPPATILYQNFPNPFPNVFEVGHSGTRIWFDLARSTSDSVRVELAVFDTRGRLVRQLIPARPDCGRIFLPPGLYGRSGQSLDDVAGAGCARLEWDGTDTRGNRVPRGAYVLRLRADGIVDVRRMLFLPN